MVKTIILYDKGRIKTSKIDLRILAYKETAHFPWKSIWRTKVPLKVVFFRFGGSSREDPYFGQSQKEASHCD